MRFKTKVTPHFEKYYPDISTITSVYNEQLVIQEKIYSIINSDYPKEKLHIYIGSDASTDQSNSIIKEIAEKYPQVHFELFKTRRGKSFVINDLMELAFQDQGIRGDHILLFTDASVMLNADTLQNLSRNFLNEKVSLVDSRIFPFGLKEEGISKSESTYIALEAKLKWMEGQLWGMMMGAFGGCYAIRSNFATKVPPNFLMDDFFISMSTLDMGGTCISDLEANCYEGVPDKIEEEFRRKVRISAGNFQNLNAFKHFLWTLPVSRMYSFFCHKVLRWFGPFLLIFIGITSCILSFYSLFYKFCFWGFISMIFIFPLTDWILQKFQVHIKPLRNIRYFFGMNLALFIGFVKYMKGIKNSSWEPPKRIN